MGSAQRGWVQVGSWTLHDSVGFMPEQPGRFRNLTAAVRGGRGCGRIVAVGRRRAGHQFLQERDNDEDGRGRFEEAIKEVTAEAGAAQGKQDGRKGQETSVEDRHIAKPCEA
jgi:hypothetical protein